MTDIPKYKYEWALMYFYNTISRLENDFKELQSFHNRDIKYLTQQDYLDLIILQSEIETYKTIFDDILKIFGKM